MESTWATLEGCILPYLSYLHVSPTYSTMVWLANPLIGLFAFIPCAAMSDAAGNASFGSLEAARRQFFSRSRALVLRSLRCNYSVFFS